MKKFLMMLTAALMAAGLMHTAQADSLDAYRPKKSGSLTCRVDEPASCDTPTKQQKPKTRIVKKQQTFHKRMVKYTKTTHPSHRARQHHIRH